MEDPNPSNIAWAAGCAPSGDIEHLCAQDGYDRWAAVYDGEDNPLIALEEPEVDRLLGDMRGRAVLDLGCGTGRHALRLAQHGARATGLDFSSEMLARARDKAARAGLQATFRQHDLGCPLPADDAAFDALVCGLVLEHIADLELLFREMRRVVRPAGPLVVTAMHPAMMLRGVTARFTDPTTGRETRPCSHAHQISDFVMAALRAGLALDHLGERLVTTELTARSPRAQKYLNWPMLLVMRLRSPAPPAPAVPG
jgi:ubiquinone/menaquinone biosynthesis C-methylase UbiE